MQIEDKDLGLIKLVENTRARRIIVRKKDEFLQLTYPLGVSMSYIEKVLHEMKPRLLKMVERKKEKLTFTPDTQFETFSFELRIQEASATTNYYVSLKGGILSISCPLGTDFKDALVQDKIRLVLENAFRNEAKRIFPYKVKMLAERYNFTVTDVKINKSRTRWGSCNSKKSINLSYFCMLLPEHLVDFIMLHELCHTIEMNHGPRFWEQLDRVTGGRAKELTKELKLFKINW
ncbi:M48 family metallopeptidase [Dysgonomonas sp. Marseille-P4361]|uniref:M48 family metallopeptidase n=1 Tax=Dysgonomonas sp. Marseille-P4361 TaxID=2161820 RepID=UPI000D5531A8|nr:YgjP-like metallopeptidase domain-containing protein [Dysgonomonas sp. Marseille-P4361]